MAINSSLRPVWSWSSEWDFLRIGCKAWWSSPIPFLSLILAAPSYGNAQVFPIQFQPPVFTIWDVRALFKIKLVTTQLLFWTGNLWKVLFVCFREAHPSSQNCDGQWLSKDFKVWSFETHHSIAMEAFLGNSVNPLGHHHVCMYICMYAYIYM